MIERATILAGDGPILPEHLPAQLPLARQGPLEFDPVDRGTALPGPRGNTHAPRRRDAIHPDRCWRSIAATSRPRLASWVSASRRSITRSISSSIIESGAIGVRSNGQHRADSRVEPYPSRQDVMRGLPAGVSDSFASSPSSTALLRPNRRKRQNFDQGLVGSDRHPVACLVLRVAAMAEHVGHVDRDGPSAERRSSARDRRSPPA